MFNSLIRTIRDELNWLNKVLQYAIFLRKDRDWDYGFFLRLMKYKLGRMADCIESNEIIVAHKRVAKQIRYACFLIGEIEKESSSLCEKEMKCFEDKWGQLTMDDSIKHLKFYFPKAKSPAEQKVAREEFTALQALQDKTYRDRKKRLFRHLDCYMEKWWD